MCTDSRNSGNHWAGLAPAVLTLALTCAVLACSGDPGFMPQTPTGLAAGANSPTEIELSWTDSTPGEPADQAWFIVQRRYLYDSRFEEVGTAAGGTTTLVDSGVLANAIYEYRVAEANVLEVSSFSNPVTVSTSGLWAPAAPTGFALATPNYNGELSMSWEDRSFNEEVFVVELRETGGSYNAIMETDADAIEVTHDAAELSDGMVYEYRIMASNPYGDSSHCGPLQYVPNHAYRSRSSRTPPDASSEAAFGSVLAIAGSYAIVGVPEADTISSNGGLAIVYEKIAGSWGEGIVLSPLAGLAAGDNFAESVDIDGEIIVCGAPHDNGDSTGAAYAFERTGPESWDDGTKLLASDGNPWEYFGTSVAVSDNYIAVGSPLVDGATTNTGAVYVFQRTGPGAWDSGTKLTVDSEQIGRGISIDGDYLVALDPDGFQMFVFHRTGPNTWDAGTVVAVTGVFLDAFSSPTVAISGNCIAVGAPMTTVQEEAEVGVVLIYERVDVNAWSLAATIASPDVLPNQKFGSSLAWDGDRLLVGAEGMWYFGNDEYSTLGVAYIYEPDGAGGWDATMSFRRSGDESIRLWFAFGRSVGLSSESAIIGAPCSAFEFPNRIYLFD